MLTNFHNIWHTVYWSNLQHNTYWHVYLTCVLLLYYLGNINFWFLDNFGLFVSSTKLLKWLRNVTIKSDQWKIIMLHITMMFFSFFIFFYFFTFQYVQLQYLTFVNKDIVTQFKFFLGSVAILCRWSGQINNSCVATYLNMLCAKYHQNGSMFV